jgi:hypothetical protein
MIPDLLGCAVAAIGIWTFLRLVGGERERKQLELAAIAAANPPPSAATPTPANPQMAAKSNSPPKPAPAAKPPAATKTSPPGKKPGK